MKTTMSGANERAFVFRPKLIAASVAVCFALNASQLLANPTGATVASGSAGFATAGNTLTVTNSANAIINWQGFSIGINEITRFLQPSAASAVLNRVVGSSGVIPQSVIDGVLSSNGRVFLLNPMGVVIGASARIDVAGLLASSLNLSDQDFLNGTLRFTEVPGAGAVVNHGVIETVSGGRVYLVAPQVENSGIIRAPQGEIVLAAGKSADLISESSPYVTVRVVADSEQALNVGSLVANSGRIGMYGALLRHTGVAEANGAMAGPGGQIRFVAAKDLTVDAGSRVSANGTSGGQVVLQAEGGTNLIAGNVEATGDAGNGGTVQALGMRVGVIGNGVIDASGETGGGTVLVGGDFQGNNAAVQNAQRTLIGSDGVIRADARTTGDGGRVIVWADGDTRFHGSISTRGGLQRGDGGFVEVSGKQHLAFHGKVDTRAPNGNTGVLLLDPSEIEIRNGTSDGDDGDASAASFDGTFPYGPTPSVIFESEMEGTAATTSVTVTASTSIRIKPLADGELSLAYGGSFSAGSGGITMENTSNTIRTMGRSLDFSASYGGPVTLGNLRTDGVAMSDASTYISISGGPVSTGTIITGNTTASNSYVDIDATGGGVTTGSITTGNSAESSYVRIYSGSSIGGSIATGSITTGNAAQDTSVYIEALDGSVATGNIQTGSATDGSEGASTYVSIYAGLGNIVTGSIATGNATSSSCCSGDADSSVSLNAPNGTVSTQGIQTGAAVASDGGESSAAAFSYLEIIAGFGVVTGPIATGAALGSDGSDSSVNIETVAGGIATGSITTGVAIGGDSYVDLIASSPATISTGDISTGAGSDDSSVTISDSLGAVSTGSITTGISNDFSYIDIFGAGNITTGALTTRPSLNLGGGGVFVQTTSGSIAVNGVIDARGADGAHGSSGGEVVLLATNSISVGPPATPGINRVVINTSGGNSSANGAYGGHAGSVFIDPVTITINGVIHAIGGAGGPGGPGGSGGHLALLTPNGGGTITFINGGWDLSGGSGSPPGSNGLATIRGTLIFISLLSDALSNPAVAQAVGQSIEEILDVTDLEKSETEKDDDSATRRKKGFASCKPA